MRVLCEWQRIIERGPENQFGALQPGSLWVKKKKKNSRLYKLHVFCPLKLILLTPEAKAKVFFWIFTQRLECLREHFVKSLKMRKSRVSQRYRYNSRTDLFVLIKWWNVSWQVFNVRINIRSNNHLGMKATKRGLKVLFNFAEVQLIFILKMMQKHVSAIVKSCLTNRRQMIW